MRATREAEYTEYVQTRLGWLRRTAYLLCQDWQGADDLAQKTITRLYTHWGRAGRAVSLDAFVRGILVKAFLDERRSAWARRVILPGGYEERPAPCHDPDMRLDVRAALRSLPPRQRATVVLRYYCDCPVEGAAEILGVTPGTVKSQTATIADDPQGGVCDRQPPQATLTAEGIGWDYYYSTGPGADQFICALTRVDGRGHLNMYYYWRGHPQAVNLASLVRSMTFLGPDPSGWATQPMAG